MKVFISADLEGISGVAAMDDVIRGKEGYAAACKAMTGDVNAAIEGALEGGAEAIVVFDAHADGRNIDLDLLHPAAEIIRGQPMPVMIAGLDDTFAALFLIGYHAMRGAAAAVMDHTYTGRFHRVTINGRDFGEPGLAAAYAGAFGVPVALVAGDDKLRDEARDFLPGALCVVTKTGMGRHSARCRHPKTVQAEIREKAAQALTRLDTLEPFVLDPPLALEVEYASTASADRAACIPTVERTGARSIAASFDAVPPLVRLLSILSCIAV